MEIDGPWPFVYLVIPCLDEADRLSEKRFGVLAADDRVALVFVDDGSTDDTRVRLAAFASSRANVSVVALDENVGKGEAVRVGMLRALSTGATWVGYVDADLATPESEVLRLIDIATVSTNVDVVLGSRIAMLGRQVRRSRFRHYTGRVFATGASLVLKKTVYDTQCGAKLFRSGQALEQVISVPFRSRWAFDVELLGRLDRAGVGSAAFREEPLEVWSDVPATKRTLAASVRAVAELLAIRRDLDRWDSG
jgi:dolichyl-phosphate beta-glucosyltransferase